MSARLTVSRHLPADFLARALRADVSRGLDPQPKQLPPTWFCDKVGSALFEEITRLPEYDPTRAEREILTARAGLVADLTGAEVLLELGCGAGSGSADRTRLLLDALVGRGTLRRYVPVDVSESALLESSDALLADYPRLHVHAVLVDFERHLDLLPRGRRRLTAFLGGTIGSLLPEARAAFLSGLRRGMRQGDALLLGADLVQDAAVRVPAYDDAGGVTAAFNRNLLTMVNRELGADFDVEAFEHVARWDAEHEWTEMRLRSRRDQTVRVRDLGLVWRFAAGEEMRTEISARFRRDRLEAELSAAGLELVRFWTDAAARFAVVLAVPSRHVRV